MKLYMKAHFSLNLWQWHLCDKFYDG